MKNPFALATDKLGGISISVRLFAVLAVIVFGLSVNYWAKAYSRAEHEVDAVFDAKGVSSFALETRGSGPRQVVAFPVYYKDANCDWDVQIDALGEKGPKALGVEIWVQSVSADGKPVAWNDVKADAGWVLKDSVHGANGKALASFGEGVKRSLHVKTHANTLTIVYSRHQWTGKMRLAVNGTAKEIDTWSESFIPEKASFYAPPTANDHVENQTASVYLTPEDIGDDSLLKLANGSGVAIKSIAFDGKPLTVNADGTVKLPAQAATVWRPATGIGFATTLAVMFAAALLWVPVKKHPLGCFFTFVVLVKLWLVGGDEIRASIYDSNGYMLSSINRFWDMAFTAHAYDRQPGYPLFISAARFFGIPLRIWIELAYCGACLSIATALTRLKLPKWSAALAFALMVFNPITYPVFSYGYQDVAYAPFLLLFIGSMLHALPDAGRWRIYACCAAGVSGALVWNTRPEHILVLLLIATFAAAIVFVEWAGTRSVAKSLTRAVFSLVPIVAAILAVTLLLCAYGRTTRLGSFATCNFQLKGFSSLYNELLAIKPEKPEAYHPVPTDVRLTAYKFSPTFATLRGPLEGPALELYAPMARAGDGIVNDYGTYFFWALRIAPWYDRQWRNADELDRFYGRCAEELHIARIRGAYPSRFVYASFVEPDASLWLPNLGKGMSAYAKILTRTDVAMLQPEDPGVSGELFDKAALRRASLAKANNAIWTTPHDATVEKTKGALARISALSTYGATLLFIPAVVILIRNAKRRFDVKTAAIAAACVVAIVAFASRFMVMSVMYAVAFRDEPRYLLPVAMLPALLFSIFLAIGWEELTKGFKRKKDTSNG
jgi:hypothetical protein